MSWHFQMYPYRAISQKCTNGTSFPPRVFACRSWGGGRALTSVIPAGTPSFSRSAPPRRRVYIVAKQNCLRPTGAPRRPRTWSALSTHVAPVELGCRRTGSRMRNAREKCDKKSRQTCAERRLPGTGSSRWVSERSSSGNRERGNEIAKEKNKQTWW